MIKIKPHHFFDIIKLFGKGIEKFVPDEKYNHDFYQVANEIIANHQLNIQLVLGGDDICSPCIYIDENGLCTDNINHIINFNSKDQWNKAIDNRIIELTKVSENSIYTAEEYCKKLFSIKEHIRDVWQEEADEAYNNRYDLFCIGAKKYLGLS